MLPRTIYALTTTVRDLRDIWSSLVGDNAICSFLKLLVRLAFMFIVMFVPPCLIMIWFTDHLRSLGPIICTLAVVIYTFFAFIFMMMFYVNYDECTEKKLV